MIREGEDATFIGSTPGLTVGDRCRVLACETTYANVKWLTGARTGSIEAISTRDLAPDRQVRYTAWQDDAFGFEPEPEIKRVRVATASVHARGGDDGLLRALDAEGLLDGVRSLAADAIRKVHATLSGEPAWREVVSELGERGGDFLTRVVRDGVTAALDGDWDDDPTE